MANDGRKIATNCALSVISIGLLSAIVYYLQSSQNLNSSLDLSSVSQIKDDWMLAPYTDIILTEDKYCPAGYSSIWMKIWGGTVQGCDCTNVWNMSAWKHHLQVDDSCYDDDEYQCYYEPARSAIIEQEFDDVWICGKRDGKSFSQAVRPNANNTCPSGTERCSNNTSAENTICSPISEHRAKCPITEIKFVKERDLHSYTNRTNATWSTPSTRNAGSELDIDGYKITWSKDTNALPVTATKLEYQPCMNPNQVSVSPGQVFYALERDINNGCKADANNGFVNDPRYVRTGLEISEYDLQDESNAWDTMEYMAQFNPQMQKQQRKTQKLYGWTRPTIAWNLSCEGNTETSRDAVMWTFAHPFSMPGRVGVALGFAYTVLILEGCCLVCSGWMSIKEGENEYITGGRGIATCCGCLFMLNVVWMLATAVTMQDDNLRTLDGYQVVNDCSDQYTHVDVDYLSPKIIKSTANLKTASFVAYGLLAIYTVACCVVGK